MPAESEKTDSKLSPSTLVIASVASAAAAIFIHEVWTGGAIVGAAITPVIVAIVSESLKKPTEKLSAVTARPARRGATRAPEPVEAQAVELQREDRFGIWEDEKRGGQGGSAWHKLNRKHLKIALATGALAFVVAVVALTTAELVFGGSVGSSGERTTIFRGGSDSDADKTTTTSTTEQDDTATTPEEAPQTEPIPQETTPPATTPTTPAPATTTPAPATPAPDSGGTPAPAPGATQPATPAPVP